MFDWVAVLDFLNSREDALLFWAVGGGGLALYQIPALRPATVELGRAMLHRKLLSLWIATGVFTVAVVAVAERIGWWHSGSFNETAYWLFGTAR
jgi:hypothetical protein